MTDPLYSLQRIRQSHRIAHLYGIGPRAAIAFVLAALIAQAPVARAAPHDAGAHARPSGSVPNGPIDLTALPTSGSEALDRLREKALNDVEGLHFLEALTTEIGPRLPGSPAEARARTWLVQRLKALGFSAVRVEPFSVPYWVRGDERAEITAPFTQPLKVTALGNSGATGPNGLVAELAPFPSLAALEAAPRESVAGKIVFVDHRMTAAQDGSSYGDAGAVRRRGPSVASAKGAAAIVIRSIGTDESRSPHTGVQNWEGQAPPIPAAALSVVDSELLNRIFARGHPVTMRLVLTPKMLGTAESGNVIADLPGTDPAAGMIVIGGHLDSWDLGTGAIDDAAGIAITAVAAKLAYGAGPRPRRTIRFVGFGAEEIGIFGGKAYAEAHKADAIALVAESDFGADRVWQVRFTLPEAAKPLADRVAAALAPLGIARGTSAADGGPDVRPLVTAGAPTIDLAQDGTRYFDLHHTAEDTFDKVDPDQLRQNIAAWAMMLRLSADAPESLSIILSN